MILTKLLANLRKFKAQITDADITIFLRQFATLLTAGIPIIKACTLLEKSQTNHLIRVLIFTIRREIATGKSLFESLQAHRPYFDNLTLQLIYIGEHTGRLDVMLVKIANHHEQLLAFKKRIKQALFYPTLVMVTAAMITLSLFLFVVPKFAELFIDMQVKLPKLTLAIFYFSSLCREYFFLLSLALLLLIIMLLYSPHRPYWQTTWRGLFEKIPILKQYRKKLLLLRFARNLAISFAAGISITTALQLITKSSSHPVFTQITHQLRIYINAGIPLHHAMEKTHYFPMLMIQMVKIGEETAMLDQMLNKIADFFESDIDQFINLLTQLLEPLIMIVLGVLIGGLIIAIYIPIFNLGSML